MRKTKDSSAIFSFFGKLYRLIEKHSISGNIVLFNTTALTIYGFNGNPSLKDCVEAQGIPHTEVRYLYLNDLPAKFSNHICDGDNVKVYPIDYSATESTSQNLQPALSLPAKFVLDVHLGKLAKFLRLLGFDTVYSNDFEDEILADISHYEDRILLTMDKGLLKRKIVNYGMLILDHDPLQQCRNVLSRFNLRKYIRPLSRCSRCNGLLFSTDKESIKSRLLPLTIKYYDSFHLCDSCGQVYWRGAHYNQLINLVEKITTDG